MTVYKMLVELNSPMASSDPFIHMDSFLSYAAGIESIGYDELHNIEEKSEPVYFEDEMPLKKYKTSGEWVWASSVAMTLEEKEIDKWCITNWKKRFDVDQEHQKKDTQIPISAGKFKSYNSKLAYAPVERIIFLFEGDPEKVKTLMKNIDGIGKKTSQGYGKIKDYSIEPTDKQYSIYDSGHTLRSLPKEFISGIEPGIRVERRTVRPPYWHPDNQKMSLPPFTEISRDNIILEGVKDE